MNKRMYLCITIVISILGLCGFVYLVQRNYAKSPCMLDRNSVVDVISDQDWFKAIAAQDLNTIKAHMNMKYGVKNQEGLTGLMIAAKSDLYAVAKLLLDNESRLLTADGTSALMYAVEAGCVSIAKMLVDKEAGIVSHDGSTALMHAAKHGYVEIASLLLHKEAGRFNYNGETALMIAAMNGHVEIVKLLVDKELGMKDIEGRTAFVQAINYGRVEAAKLLMAYPEESSGYDCRKLLNDLIDCQTKNDV